MARPEGLARRAPRGDRSPSAVQAEMATPLMRAKFYTGYGTDTEDMARNGRYRGVYKVQ